MASPAEWDAAFKSGVRDMNAAQTELVQDIFGNPFRSVRLGTGGVSSEAMSLAQQVYDDCSFHRIAELADALEHAGCSHPEAIAHCRQEPQHFRGCWVVDRILGKE